MEFLEPEVRRKSRYQMQLDLLELTEFDVGLFQEVNPLLDRSHTFEKSLKREAFYQSDLVGVKILGVGLPGDLNSGLMTLAPKAFGMRRVKGVKLSGMGRSFVSPWLSFQLREERYALLTEFIHPDWGRVLVVNTHLHHGLELTEALEEELTQKSSELEISSSVLNEVFDRLQKGNQRRLREMKNLMGVIESISSRYAMVVLGGDLNERPDGEVGQLLKDYGFEDSFQLQHLMLDMKTFDSHKNESNHHIQSRFPLTVPFEDLSFSKKTTEGLREILSRHEGSARRIDQIWVRAKGKSLKTDVKLIGLEGEEGFAPSDHFGYLVHLQEK
ncbi:MAG TPA: hypothetical protein DCL41_07735 [Bdellovibrionales bacterium]|nr:hypothetical protein [Pseudobdellovibrionaceae bacterium]HAG91746.1 hypothetical protein [Bdellovibrionales bacterium]